MFTFALAGSKAHCGWCGQQAALGWEISRVILGGKTASERARKGTRGVMKWQMPGTHPGSELSPRGWQTGLCHPPTRLPASDVTSASPCVSADCHSITSREITPGCYSNVTSWDRGVLSPSNQQGVPGDGGVPAPLPQGGWGSHPAPGTDWCYPFSHEQLFMWFCCLNSNVIFFCLYSNFLTLSIQRALHCGSVAVCTPVYCFLPIPSLLTGT